MRIFFPSILLLFLLGITSGQAQEGTLSANHHQPGSHTFGLQSQGDKRSYLVHVPSGFSPKQKYPVVIMLHGGGGRARGTRWETGWDRKADKEGFLVVFPNALARDPTRRSSVLGNPQLWNDGSGRLFQDRDPPDDVVFLGSVLDDMASRYPVDKKRIYLTGFSNGASMCFLAAAGLSPRIAAAAPVSGALWQAAVKVERPVPLCYVTGDEDPLNPLPGGRQKTANGQQRGLPDKPKPPVEDSIRAWARAAGCSKIPHVRTDQKGVITKTYRPEEGGAEVVFIIVPHMGHFWAGGKTLLPERVIGKSSDIINATDVIWEFFTRHTLR